MTTLRFDIDLSQVETADNRLNETTYFGGFYTLDGETKPAGGDDRSWNYLDDVMEHIGEKCEQTFGERPDNEDLLDVLMSLESGTLLVEWRGGKLVAKIDEA